MSVTAGFAANSTDVFIYCLDVEPIIQLQTINKICNQNVNPASDNKNPLL